MRRILTLALAAHWMCVFTMLAAVCALDPGRGFAGPLLFLGAEANGIEQDGGSQAAALFAVAFALAAVLFLLPLVELALDGNARRAEPGLRRAFAASALSLTLLLLAGALHAVPNLVSVLHTVLAAALVSYLAASAERRACEEDGGSLGPARTMAVAAAQSSLLAGLSGRNPGDNPIGRS